MTNQENPQDKQHQIVFREPLWSENHKKHTTRIVRVPTTKQDFDDYYRPINAFRKRQQEHGRCVCPPKARLLCDMDCETCPHHTAGDMSSLNALIADENGETDEVMDKRLDEAEGFESVLEDRELLIALYQRLEKLDPDGRRICNLIMQGATERAAAAELGVSRNTYTYRRDKLLAKLREELEAFK